MSIESEKLHPEGITPLTSGLIEPSLPEAISWFPDAPGWVVLAGLLAVYILYRLYLLYRQYQSNAYRRAALKLLAEIARVDDEQNKLPLLVRRTALYAYPREEVAPLVGREWEVWLDSRCPGSEFSKEHSGLLSALAYSPKNLSDEQQLSSFRSAIGYWIKNHEVNND